MKIIDMHCDTILGLLEKEQKYQDVSLYANDLCVDIQKLKAGDYLIQNFALFTDQKTLEIPEHLTIFFYKFIAYFLVKVMIWKF